MTAARPVPSGAPAEEWDDLDVDVLSPSRSSSVCITCQHFRYEVGRHCVTLLTCPIHQGLIPQGEHLTKRCSQWVARQEVGQWHVSVGKNRAEKSGTVEAKLANQLANKEPPALGASKSNYDDMSIARRAAGIAFREGDI